MKYEYMPVPFSVSAKRGENLSAAAAREFRELLQEGTDRGYEYYRMDHYSVYEKPGCIASLFGQSTSVVTYDVAIFRKPL